MRHPSGNVVTGETMAKPPVWLADNRRKGIGG